jgi:hypothetical protein
MIRLQQPYTLKEVPEIQQYLNFVLDPTRMTADEDMLHRRRYVVRRSTQDIRTHKCSHSRLIEPRVEDEGKQAKGSDLFGWASNFGSVRGNPIGTL